MNANQETTIRDLDDNKTLGELTQAAVRLGFLHVSLCQKRVKPVQLLSILNNNGGLKCRRFHLEILNRAYGLAFTNQSKLAWMKKHEISAA